MEKKQLPKMFTVLKIMGCVLLAVSIALFIIGATKHVPAMGDSGWFEAETSKNDLLFGGGVCLMFGIFLLIGGFSPKINKAMSKVHIQTTSEIIQENKEDLKTISDTTADISAGAITKTTKAIKDGIKDTMFCKHCGQAIDADSVFCKHCGKQL